MNDDVCHDDNAYRLHDDESADFRAA